MPPDSGRNHALNAIAYSLGRYIPKWLNELETADLLYNAARSCGLEHAEIGPTIASGIRAGQAEPLDPPTSSDDHSSLADLVAGPINVQPLQTTPTPPQVNVDPTTGEITPATIERTTWWPHDITRMVAGDIPDEPAPAYLARSDGHRLFYAGKINGLIGESESGKTWVALMAVTQALAIGEPVLYLDFEDTAAAIISRLQLLGATPAHLATFSYISPDEHFGVMQHRDLSEHVAATQPRLVILDGYNAAMTMLGLNLIDNTDIYKFALTLLRPLKKTGAAVVTIDHVTKNKEGRGAFAIGGQAKRSDVDGCALLVEVIQPFGKGMAGKLRLTVSKDRPGQVRAVSTGAKNAGMAHIDSTSGISTRGWIESPDLRPAIERGPFRPTGLMEKVTRYLQTCAEPASGKNVETSVGSKAEHVRAAVAALVTEGYVKIENGPRNALLHSLIKPYIEANDPTSSTSSPPRPHLVPDEVAAGQTTSSLVPPSKGDEDEVDPAGPRTTTQQADLVPKDEDDEEPQGWWTR